MPVGIGILCERCRTVHFISLPGKSAHIHYDRTRKEFSLVCLPSCGQVTCFHRGMLKPYSVSAGTLERGYADIAECRPMAEIKAVKSTLDVSRISRPKDSAQVSSVWAPLTTERLILRHWRESDREPFARWNADPRVMEFMPHVLSREESDSLADRIYAHFRQRGFGLCAVELRQNGSFIGFIGLNVPSFEAPFTPCVEIGWRLGADYWGQGLATEGAREIVRYGFEILGLEALVSFTVPANARARRVMEKLGMTHNPADDFDHPRLPEDHPLRRHVLYRLHRSAWGGGTPL